MDTAGRAAPSRCAHGSLLLCTDGLTERPGSDPTSDDIDVESRAIECWMC
jgi:hypothetical protein